MSLVPYDDRDGYIWYDGEMTPWRDVNCHILTHALHYASAVFEGTRVYGGQGFKLTQHNERLKTSAEIMGFEIPYDVATIDQACKQVIAANGLSDGDGYLRPIAWRGSEMMGVSAQACKIHLAIAAWEWPAYFTPEARMEGIRMTWAKYKRPAPETAPTQSKAAGLYMICTLCKHDAEAAGYNDALMLDFKGRVAECTGANIFFVKDGEVHTPMADCFLNGLTRQTVISELEKKQIKVHERIIEPSELEGFQQCWLTGTAAEVTPVGQIADYNFEVGALTLDIANTYEKLVRA